MNRILLDRLSVITKEEKEILRDPTKLNLSKYGLGKSMVVNCHRLLQSGNTIQIRPHTRFIDFPAHKHNYIEMVYMCSGKTVHKIDFEDIVLNEGELLILNRSALHEVKKADKDDIAVNFIILTEFFDRAAQMLGKDDNLVVDFLLSSLFQENKSVNYLHFEVGEILPIQNLLENLIWTIVEDEPNKSRIQQTTLGLLLLSLANHTDKLKTNSKNSYGFKNVVLRYIEENYKTATLNELSNVLGMKFSAVSKRISRQFNCTFKDLVMSKRLSQAEYLLKNSDLTIKEIILAVGYENVSYFYRSFKERYMVSPAVFRGNLKKEMSNKDNVVSK